MNSSLHLTYLAKISDSFYLNLVLIWTIAYCHPVLWKNFYVLTKMINVGLVRWNDIHLSSVFLANWNVRHLWSSLIEEGVASRCPKRHSMISKISKSFHLKRVWSCETTIIYTHTCLWTELFILIFMSLFFCLDMKITMSFILCLNILVITNLR